MAQGEQLHLTTWPPLWPTRRVGGRGGKQYDNLAANRTRTAAHCFEAKCFGVLCSGFMDREMREEMINHAPEMEATLDGITQGASLFLDPTGAQVGEQIQGEEGIVYADLDLNECVEPKQFHDTVGYYQRYDVFGLKVNRKRQGPETVFADHDKTAEQGVESLPQHTAAPASGRIEEVDGTHLPGRGSMRIL
jgi:nitrilase